MALKLILTFALVTASADEGQSNKCKSMVESEDQGMMNCEEGYMYCGKAESESRADLIFAIV